MKKLLYFPIIFILTAFTCESDEPLVEDEPSIFPEAAIGEAAVSFEGEDYILDVEQEGTITTCAPDVWQIGYVPFVELPDGRRLSFLFRIGNPELGTVLWEDFSNEVEFCSRTRVGVFVYEADGSFVVYSSLSDWGGFGTLNITEFEFVPESGADNYFSAEITLTAGGFVDGEPTGEFIEIVARLNRIPLTLTCSSPSC
ncbi:hypothetical protein [Gilvibacter sp.]|uniref:hypothetical protein n=1 Tax=Gilvibacter sp. TaxID=2729997 RepID=UPI003B529A0A